MIFINESSDSLYVKFSQLLNRVNMDYRESLTKKQLTGSGVCDPYILTKSVSFVYGCDEVIAEFIPMEPPYFWCRVSVKLFNELYPINLFTVTRTLENTRYFQDDQEKNESVIDPWNAFCEELLRSDEVEILRLSNFGRWGSHIVIKKFCFRHENNGNSDFA